MKAMDGCWPVKSDPTQCLICEAAQQHHLHSVGCSNEDIEHYCGNREPAKAAGSCIRTHNLSGTTACGPKPGVDNTAYPFAQLCMTNEQMRNYSKTDRWLECIASHFLRLFFLMCGCDPRSPALLFPLPSFAPPLFLSAHARARACIRACLLARPYVALIWQRGWWPMSACCCVLIILHHASGQPYYPDAALEP